MTRRRGHARLRRMVLLTAATGSVLAGATGCGTDGPLEARHPDHPVWVEEQQVPSAGSAGELLAAVELEVRRPATLRPAAGTCD